jgi:hypothetical protein
MYPLKDTGVEGMVPVIIKMAFKARVTLVMASVELVMV